MGTFPWPFSYRIPFLVSTKWLYSRASSVAIFWLCWLGFRTRLTAGETEKPWEKGLLEQAPYNAPVSGSSLLPLGSGERLLKLQSKLPLDTHCNLCVFRCLQLTDSDSPISPWGLATPPWVQIVLSLCLISMIASRWQCHHFVPKAHQHFKTNGLGTRVSDRCSHMLWALGSSYILCTSREDRWPLWPYVLSISYPVSLAGSSKLSINLSQCPGDIVWFLPV